MKKDDEIEKQLAKYQVDVPEFPMRKSLMNRISEWFFQPVSIPFPEKFINYRALVLITFFPIIIVLATFIPVFL